MGQSIRALHSSEPIHDICNMLVGELMCMCAGDLVSNIYPSSSGFGVDYSSGVDRGSRAGLRSARGH
jgi:hypothetical protein